MGNIFVYAVVGFDAHDSQVIKVFSTEEKANDFLEKYESDEDFAFITVREWEVE